MNNPRARYKFGEFILDVGQQRLSCPEDGRDVVIAGKAFDTLVYLLEHPGEPLERSQLLKAIWPGLVVEENSLTQVISSLRELLGEKRGENRYIATIPRMGYRFIAPVRELRDEEPHGVPPRRTAWMVAAAAVVVIATGLLIASFRDWGAPEAHSLAILPFKPLVAAERNEALELGMTEALIERLGRDSRRTVRPLSSIRRFVALDQDPIAAGRELGVDTVLEGLMQRDAERLRVSVRLLRVSDGRQLWSESFEQPFIRVFALQETIVASIAESLAWPEIPRPRNNRDVTRDPEAFALFASARFAYLRITEQSLMQSIGFYEAAIARDPGFARAYAGIADANVLLSVIGARAPAEAYARGRAAADHALQLDPELPAAHVSLAQILTVRQRDLPRAELAIRRAIELDPHYAPAYFYRGVLSSAQGNLDGALAAYEESIRLEPNVLANRAARGLTLLHARRVDESIAAQREILALDDRFDLARSFLMRALLAKGEYEEVLSQMKAREIRGPGSFGFVAQALVLSGKRGQAMIELDRLVALAGRQHVPAYDVACVYAALGDPDSTFDWLNRALEDGSPIGALAFDPAFDRFHHDPRFAQIILKLRTPRA